MIVRIWLLSIILLTFCLGCAPSAPPQLYTIIITSPAGHSVTYHVMSYNKPRPKVSWGGHIQFVDGGTIAYHDWEKNIIAPNGWLTEVKEGKLNAEKSNSQ